MTKTQRGEARVKKRSKDGHMKTEAEASAGQGISRIAHIHQKLGKRPGADPP